MKNSRPSRTVELPAVNRFRQHRQSTAAAAAAAAGAGAAVRMKQTQPSKQGGGLTSRPMTRGRKGRDLSPAVGVACHPPIQPLGQAQTTAAAAGFSVNQRQPGASGSELEVDIGLSPCQKKHQQHQHQQHQQHQYQHQHQQKGADKASSSSSSSSSNINSSAARSGRDDELVFDKQAAETRRLLTKVIASTTATAAAAASHPWSKIPAGSVGKAMDKGYAEWSTVLLRRVCARRRIRGMSSCEERETMAQLLAEQDDSEGRPSPHLNDVEEIVLGITRDTAYRDPKEEFSETDPREEFCDMLLPEGARIDYSGTAALADSGVSGRGAAGDGLSSAQRRLSAKRKARELHLKTSQERKELLKAERAGQAKKTTKTVEEKKCMSKALSRVLPRVIDRVAPAKTNWLERAREAEAECAKLAQSVTVYKAHKKFSIEMEELVRGGGGETEEGGGRSSIFRENYLDNVLQKLEARMLKDADADI